MFLGIIMASYGANNDIGMQEAQAIISQKNMEELTKLLSNEDELTKFISNLSEVAYWTSRQACQPSLFVFFF